MLPTSNVPDAENGREMVQPKKLHINKTLFIEEAISKTGECRSYIFTKLSSLPCHFSSRIRCFQLFHNFSEWFHFVCCFNGNKWNGLSDSSVAM